MCWAATVAMGAILVAFSDSVQCIEKDMPKMLPGVSKQMKGMLEERHAGGVFVLWTSVTARGCCPSGWYSWTMRLKKFGTQPWQSAYDV